MFRDDFEFHDQASASHLAHTTLAAAPVTPATVAAPANDALIPTDTGSTSLPTHWAPEAQKELQKIPFFVRGKARRNTERYASERGVATITVETLYDAKAHFGR